MKKMIRIIVCFICAVSMLCSCNQTGQTNYSGNLESLVRNMKYDQVDEAFDLQLKSSDGFVTVAESDNLTLCINKTAEIAVKNKASNKIWYSNPQNDRDLSDPLHSQIIINYADKTWKLFEKNSYSDAVLNQQYSFYALKNGVRVNFTIGIKPKEYIVPNVLSAERFEEILSKVDEMGKMQLEMFYIRLSTGNMSDADKAYLINQYPLLNKSDIYILSTNGVIGKDGMSDMLLESLEPIFAGIGYTKSDMQADQKISGESVVKEKDTSVTLSIEYTLNNGSLEVKIPRESIEYDASVIELTNISVLPYFGSTDEHDGYLFVPDGSGALIDFSNEVENLSSYQKPIYGQDCTTASEQIEQGDGSQIYLPIYGMKAADQAFLAIITAGEASAAITADVQNSVNEYPFIYSRFLLKASNTESKSVLNVSGSINFQRISLQSDIALKYIFLHAEKADYVGMAEAYRKYCLENDLINKQDENDSSVFVELLGAITYTKRILGIPTRQELSLTSYQQAKEIVSQLECDRLTLQYSGWQNGGIENSLGDKIKYLGALGSRLDFQQLNQYLSEKNIKFYPAVQLMYLSKTTGFNANQHASQNLSQMHAYKYDYDLSLLEINEKKKSLIISPAYYNEMIHKYIVASKKEKLNAMALSSFGNELNSDFKKGVDLDRQKAIEKATEVMDRIIQEGMQYIVEGGNFYTLKNASLVSNLPMNSGNNYLFTETVPFYQIFLHGIIPYTSEPLNLSVDYEESVLKAVEIGAIPAFIMMYSQNHVLKETDYNFYSICYESWIDKIKEINDDFSFFTDCSSSLIVFHKRQKNIAKTVYENGVTVYVNYNKDQVSIDGKTLAGKSYEIWKGDMKIG